MSIITGYGGGFKENENVIYDRHDDSDGEFDEVSKSKTKFLTKKG